MPISSPKPRPKWCIKNGKRRPSSRRKFARLETAWTRFRKSKREGTEPIDIHISPQIERLIRDSLDEDIGTGDLATMTTISTESRSTGLFRAKKGSVVTGLVLLDRIFYFIDHKVELRLRTKDGAQVTPNMIVAEAIG